MGLVSVALIFSISILFNVILPTGDVYSDVALMVNTITFNVASTLEISGCRVCHGRDEAEVYKALNQSCQQCMNSYYCGTIPKMLNKKYDLQTRRTCQAENWYVEKGSEDIKRGTCDRSQCCLKNKKGINNIVQMIDIDRRVVVFPDSVGKMCFPDYDVYLLTGNDSWVSCKRISLLENTQKELCGKAEATTQDVNEKVFKVKKMTDQNVTLIEGFHFEDGCGIYLRPSMMDKLPVLTGDICDNDACLLHLRYLHLYSSIIVDLNTWKTNTEYVSGYGKVGGKLCQLFIYYGWTISIPILINLAFSLKLFSDDYKKNNASLSELITVVFLFYPQWKTLRYLANYLFYHRDEEKLEKDRNDFDRDVSTVEPFLESSLQVRFQNIYIGGPTLP